jgi:chromosomal replication initiation ATPase DnaA
MSGGGLMRSLKGWSEIKNGKQRIKGDQRILGNSDFVLKILSEADESYVSADCKSKGHTIESIAGKISALYNINKEEILSKGRRKTVVEARSLFCYIAVHDLKAAVTEVARLVGMAPSAISYAVKRGRDMVEEKGLDVGGVLLN